MQKLVKEVIHSRLRHFLKHCHLIVVYTKAIRDLVVHHYGYEDKICIVPTGIDLLPYQEKRDPVLRDRLGWRDSQVMISVGRLSVEKNWITLIEAAYTVMQTHPRFRLALIGNGPQRRALERHVTKMGIAKQVDFLGRRRFDEIPKFLKAADFFGFASTTETIGRVTMEGMAAGLPVVAVNAHGTRELVTPGEDGLLTENDSSALAIAIRMLLDNLELQRRFGQAAARKAGNFDVKIEASRMMDVYYNAIEIHGKFNGKK